MEERWAIAKHHSVHDNWLFLPFVPSSCTRQTRSGNFSPTAAKQRWSSRINDHLSVQVRLDGGPPQHVCPKCKRELQTLERDAR